MECYGRNTAGGRKKDLTATSSDWLPRKRRMESSTNTVASTHTSDVSSFCKEKKEKFGERSLHPKKSLITHDIQDEFLN
ncbi:hypothetical protein TNCV_4121061 [Trichonephila clavipes]|nr:hypothetical protein TNCV_4121061 [Trichonephila clavipes]